MILVRKRIELFDQVTILFDRGLHTNMYMLRDKVAPTISRHSALLLVLQDSLAQIRPGNVPDIFPRVHA